MLRGFGPKLTRSAIGGSTLWSCTLCLQESSSVGDILSKKSLTAVSAAVILEKKNIVLHGICLFG